MADYRNQQDIENAQNYGFGSVLNQANSLANLLTAQKQLEAQQQFDLNKQDRAEALKQKADEAKRKAEGQQLRQMLGLPPEASDAQVGEVARKQGQSLKVGDVTIGQDPTTRLIQQQQHGQASAIQNAQNIYNKRLPKLQDMASKMHDALTAVNDPNQIGSAGAAKSMLISGVAGMSRYNQNEGSDLVPSSFLQKVNQFANTLGDGKNPLTDSQRRSINALLMEGMKGLQKTHDITRESALGAYQTSPYYEPTRGEALKSSLGAPFGKQLEDEMEQFKNYNAPVQQMAAPQPTSILDKLKGLFGGGSAPQPSQTSPTPAPQTTDIAPDPIESEMRRRGLIK